VRTREGDCTEHGVLLTAALRAAGIPARAATGMLYVESFEGAERIFGYHMWAQALIDGVWVDLDATYPDEVAFDATHVALSVSPLDDADGMMDLVTIAKLMGRLRIEVVDVARGEP
jgi:transglutaminase-like putative cysteine protease